MKVDIAEVIERLSDANEETVGTFINQVADSFRKGANLRALIPLLQHSDSRLVSAGTWIASEAVNGQRGREIFNELSRLLDHSDPAVRFGVIESVALLVKPEDHSVIHRLLLLLADPNPGVRRHALFWVCWIPDSIVESLQHTNAWPCARLLHRDASKGDIRSAIIAEQLFDQRMAVAAALRNFGNDAAFLKELFPHFDDEVVTCLPTLPKNRTTS